VIPAVAQPVPAANGTSHDRVRGYRPELDGVRFLAFSLVFLFHVLPFPTPSAGQNTWRLLAALVQSCANGLCLFFALSAYLITDLLLTASARRCGFSQKVLYTQSLENLASLFLCHRNRNPHRPSHPSQE